MPNFKQPTTSQLIIYQTKSGNIKIDVRLENGTVWLTQKLMAELFDTTKQNISLHLKNIFDEKELDENATIKELLTVQNEGNRQVSRKVEFYNLDAIISVGYRIKSQTATKFRQWATKRLQEYIIKGFVLDDERLKNPDLPFDYFEELTKRIQDIRTSEKRFYRKITDIYATSIDYDPTNTLSIEFFQTVQNKVHFAITSQTAAEIIKTRAYSQKANMGLTNFRGDKVRNTDIAIAKNYLNKEELLALNNLVEQYLIFAEGQAMRRISMKMKDWIEKLHGFLSLNDRDILKNKGKISHIQAQIVAEKEYEKFNKKQINKYSKIDDDFDKTIKLVDKTKKKLK
ncbi:MAG: virulence RhuM family protein [Bacteroidetes bacterium]|nr:virulence RhuM family protein [Bacteroidota bacterium]